MEAYIEKIKQLNREWNDLPRKLLVILATVAGLALVWAALKYLAPLACALVFACLIRPLARPLGRLFEKLHISKRIAALIACIVVFGALLALVALIVAILTDEASSLLKSLPDIVRDSQRFLNSTLDWFTNLVENKVGGEALHAINDMLSNGVSRLADAVAGFAGSMVSFTWSAVTGLPDAILFVLFTVMESYYLVADDVRLTGFITKIVPRKMSGGWNSVRDVMLKGVKAQIITALIEMLVVAVLLLVGFGILGINYALMLALLIAVLDALPVIGAGLVMTPMAIYYFIVAQYVPAIGTLVLWVVIQVLKQVLEPKLMGKQMKISQLGTMVSMYAGFVFMGYLGLLMGPLALMLFTAILGNGAKAEENTEAPKPEETDEPDGKKRRRKK